MFEGLSEKLSGIFDKLTGRGALSEADVDAAMREVRRALLEADGGRQARRARAHDDHVVLCALARRRRRGRGRGERAEVVAQGKRQT